MNEPNENRQGSPAPADGIPPDAGLLLLAAVALFVVLLIAQPVRDQFDWALTIIGSAIYLLATGYALWTLVRDLVRLVELFGGGADQPLVERVRQIGGGVAPLAALVLPLIIPLIRLLSTADPEPINTQRQFELSLSLVVLAILLRGAVEYTETARRRAQYRAEFAALLAAQEAGQQPPPEPPADVFTRIVKWFLTVSRIVVRAVEAVPVMLLNTVITILPTSSRLRDPDADYNQETKEQLTGQAEALDLTDSQRDVIVHRWIDQMVWTSDRANRERDANELIRWWQIILSASITLLAAAGTQTIFGENASMVIALIGALATVLTSFQQFRRPEERWRHYRVLSERYQDEFWTFVSLGGDYEQFAAETEPHQAAYPLFITRMTQLKADDLAAFFSQVIPPQSAQNTGQQDGAPPGAG